jgi:hypothetical protein
MDSLRNCSKLQKISDETRVDDGVPYRATKWRHESGSILEVNQDQFGHHARVNGGRAAVNLDDNGLIAFIISIFGRR